jgi:hypothetical protein
MSLAIYFLYLTLSPELMRASVEIVHMFDRLAA